MAFIGTRDFYLENEELIESKEGEREELKEEGLGKDWIKLLLGFDDFLNILNSSRSHHLHYLLHFQNLSWDNLPKKREVGLYLKYCCLQIAFG